MSTFLYIIAVVALVFAVWEIMVHFGVFESSAVSQR